MYSRYYNKEMPIYENHLVNNNTSRTEKVLQVTCTNNFGRRSTTTAIHLVRRLLWISIGTGRDLHVVFIDLEKAYDKDPREVEMFGSEKCTCGLY